MISLAFSRTPAQLAAFVMENDSCQGVSSLASGCQRFVAKAKDINEDITWAQVNEDVLRSLERPRALYWVIFLASLALFGFGVYCRSSQ